MPTLVICSRPVEELKNKFANLISKPLDQACIGYIKTAANHKTMATESEKELSFWTRLGAKLKIIELEKTSRQQIEAILPTLDAVVIAGGNTFYLEYWVRQTRLMEALAKWRGIIIGISAGAIIMGTDIGMARLCLDPPFPPLRDTRASGLINKIVWVHYGWWTIPFGWISWIKAKIYPERYLLVRDKDIFVQEI